METKHKIIKKNLGRMQNTGQYDQNNDWNQSNNQQQQDQAAMYASVQFEDPATPGKPAYGNNDPHQ